MDFSPRRFNRGSILFLALWTVCLLSVFAVTLNYTARAKLSLIKRLDVRENLSLAAEAGAERGALSIMKLFANTSKTVFALKDLPRDNMFLDQGLSCRWEASDEEGKININTVSPGVLKRFFQAACGIPEMEAQDLASCVIDWRDHDSALASASGGAENPYYRNLTYPYEAKDSDFEVLEELLLVKGMNEEIFRKVKDLLTVYGTGKVNINTASSPALLALGVLPETVDKIMGFRKGKDGLEGSFDDNVFDDISRAVSRLETAAVLSPPEKAELTFACENYLETSSGFFSIKSTVILNNGKGHAEAVSVVDAIGNILHWRQT